MGCIYTSNSNKSTITVCVRELKYYSDIFNQSVICSVRGLEAMRHLPRLRVRGGPPSRWEELKQMSDGSFNKTRVAHVMLKTQFNVWSTIST